VRVRSLVVPLPCCRLALLLLAGCGFRQQWHPCGQSYGEATVPPPASVLTWLWDFPFLKCTSRTCRLRQCMTPVPKADRRFFGRHRRGRVTRIAQLACVFARCQRVSVAGCRRHPRPVVVPQYRAMLFSAGANARRRPRWRWPGGSDASLGGRSRLGVKRSGGEGCVLGSAAADLA
jgi:hypothetical protein